MFSSANIQQKSVWIGAPTRRFWYDFFRKALFLMLKILVPIALVFFVLELLIPARRQPIFRRGFLADALYVPLHYVLRVVLNIAVASALTAAVAPDRIGD